MRITKPQLLEIIKEEILKEVRGWDVEPVAVPSAQAEQLFAAHEHVLKAMSQMEAAKQAATSDLLKDNIQKLQDHFGYGASDTLNGLAELIEMEAQLTENLLKEGGSWTNIAQHSPRENSNYPDFAPGQEIIPAYVREAKRNSVIQGLMQAHLALQKVEGQEETIELVQQALDNLGYDQKDGTLRYYQGNQAGYRQGSY